ncbi:MAG TPA: lysylphosphatidylglycerol synthase domain-containing protein [Tenuifilaceae bacterium]|nr:lysylphosphatidylglycerol synthase domain-containing protein [Bacteroidales bacterium]MDI9516792.1 lysylphosphatidylglycerol synthase domain-containing protein [Bacteroidota bacterium]NLH55700.1 hypothetical protein [Rikenellaceae bacterium]OQC63539.1 MAG: hypothetical protein BWX49_01182 [Bacteroidetes bacterium ADurb.Bin008]HOF92375.1 lysylphosphatidylglycerol synthase domain-containing protein [Tenuifilaceae bacterium]
MFKNSKGWITFFRIGFAIAAYGFIVLKLHRQGTDNILLAIGNFSITQGWPYLLAALLLMPLSWSIEAYKWKLALSEVERLRFVTAWKSVWYGVAAGFLTPNRVGDPFGRMVFISPENRGKAIVLGIWCGLSQLLATIFFGFAGLSLWFGISHSLEELFGNTLYLMAFVEVLLLVTVVFLTIGSISKYLQRVPLLRRLLAGESLSLKIKPIKSLKILGLSLLRYTVFSTQFILLLICFGIEGELQLLYSGVFLSYLFAGVVPSFTVTEVVVRSGFAVAFIGLVDPNPVAIVAATLSIWLLNVTIPTVVAVWFPWFRSDKNA